MKRVSRRHETRDWSASPPPKQEFVNIEMSSNQSIRYKYDSPHDISNFDGMTPPSASVSSRRHHASPTIALSPTPFADKQLCGFTFNFSNTVPGMLYRSRNDPKNMTYVAAGALVRQQETRAERRSQREDASTAVAGISTSSRSKETFDDEEIYFSTEDIVERVVPEKLDLRQRMALTLRNWCTEDSNMALVAKEGAIQAIAALASREDTLTRRLCAAAFSFLSRSSGFRSELVHVGACAILAQVAINTKSPQVAYSCASSLRNLSLEHTLETRLAEEGAVGAFCTLLLTFSERDVWTTSLLGLYNLTCVSVSYPGLDRVLKGLFSAYDTPCQGLDPSQIVGMAVANLSVIHRMRLRILEEGLVDILTSHILPVADAALRYNVAVALHNIACTGAGGVEMVNRGIVPCLVILTRPPTGAKGGTVASINGQIMAAEDPQKRFQFKSVDQELLPMLECLARTLQFLSLEGSVRRKCIQDGAIRAILNLLDQTTHADVLYMCARAIHAFTSFGDCSVLLIKHHAVSALVKLTDLLSIAPNAEHYWQKHSIVASFCNLLSADRHHGPVLDIKDSLTSILKLQEGLGSNVGRDDSHDEMLLEYLSCLYSNLACGASRRYQVVMAGLVPRLVMMCGFVTSPQISLKLKSRCATALANLMSTAGGNGSTDQSDGTYSRCATDTTKQKRGLMAHMLQRMVQDGVIGCLARLLETSSDETLLESVTTALALTSFHRDDMQAEMINQGIVPTLIRVTLDHHLRSDKMRHAVVAIFASLSYSARHVPHLFEAGVLDAVFLLAKTEETETRKRCATVLCNLSCNPHVRNQMVERNVVMVLAQLSNTYSDETQMDCAWCFYNMACSGGTEDTHTAHMRVNRATMVRQGAIGALLMIALVRAVTTQTREVCARALLNLITEESTARVIDDGITQGLASLCGLDSEICLQICAQAFWTLSLHPIGRAKISSKKYIMQGLCSLVRSDSIMTRSLCGATILNLLLLEPETAVLATEAGALAVVKVMCTSGDADIQVECARAIAKIAPLAACREHMSKDSIPHAMVLLAQQNQNTAAAVTALQALTCLAVSQFPLAVLLQAGILHVITYRVLSSTFLMDKRPKSGVLSGAKDGPENAGGDTRQSDAAMEVTESCVYILYRFASNKELRLAITKAQAVSAVVILLHNVCAWGEAKAQSRSKICLLESMLAATLERLSWLPASQHHIIEDGAMSALVELVKRRRDAPLLYGAQFARSLAISFANLARNEGRRVHLVSVGAIEALILVLKRGFLQAGMSAETDVVVWRAVLGMMQLSESSDDLLVTMALNGALDLLVLIILSVSGKLGERCEIIQRYAAGALCNFSRCQGCRPLLAAHPDAVEAVMALSKSTNTAIQGHCSIILANLSGQQEARLHGGSMGALVGLFKSQLRHDKTRFPGRKVKDNQRGTIQAKFRRLLMAATLAKELNDGNKPSTTGGAETFSTSGIYSHDGKPKDFPGKEAAEQNMIDGVDESGLHELEGTALEMSVEKEDKNWRAFYVRATHSEGDVPTRHLIDLRGLTSHQQNARLASWDMSPPLHDAVFYRCSLFAPQRGGITPVSSAGDGLHQEAVPASPLSKASQEGNDQPAPQSFQEPSPLSTLNSSHLSLLQSRNVIVVSHPKLSECPSPWPRASPASKEGVLVAASHAMDRGQTRLSGAKQKGKLSGTLPPAAKDAQEDRETDPQPTASVELAPSSVPFQSSVV